MTPKPKTAPPEAGEIIQFPNPPPEEMTAYYTVNWPGYPGSLSNHFGNPETTIITSEVAAALMLTPDWEGVRYPDLLIAFDVDPAANRARLGYLIPEQGKPPDFVLEVASDSTFQRDVTVKRDDYARMGVLEYWRFDPKGDLPRRTHLAGDRLVDGIYQPIPIHRTEEGTYWGRSDSLGLDLCWEEGQLRIWDPAARRYLATYDDIVAYGRVAEAARVEAEAAQRAAEARADAEAARADAEAELPASVTELEVGTAPPLKSLIGLCTPLLTLKGIGIPCKPSIRGASQTRSKQRNCD